MAVTENIKSTPLWTDQVSRPEDLPSSELPGKVDVAIVGSGYTGLNAALALAANGAKAVVLEQETIGWGASSRNGSMLTSGLKAKSKNISKWYGEDLAKYFWNWSVNAVSYVEDIVRENQIDCDFINVGNVYLASKPSHVDSIKSYGEKLNNKFGYSSTRWVPKEDIQEEIGSEKFYGGLVDSFGCRLHPAKYVYGLAQVVANKGVGLVEYAKVTAISGKRGNFTVLTEKGSLIAKEVLLATGGYTTGLVPKIRRGVFPVGSYIIVTEPLKTKLRKELSPKDRVFYDSMIFLNYFTLTTDGRFMLGGRTSLSPGLNLEKSASILRERMLEIFPQLQGVSLTHSWSGKLGVSYDQMPHIGILNGIHYAYGYSGHGISIASYLGQEVGNMLASTGSESKFMDIRHPRTIFAPLDPLYLPFVAAYFKFLDRIS